MAEYTRQEMVPGFRSASDFSALGLRRFVFVAATGPYTAGLATSPDSSLVLGVMQNAPRAGEAVSIAYSGVSKVVAGAALSANAIITTNASGRAVAVTSGQMAVGRLLEASSANGDVVTALLFHPVRWTGAA